MRFDIQEAIAKRRIIPFSDGPKLIKKEITTAKEDLQAAQESFDEGKFKWATIQAYYALFHVCRALLYNKKYREKSHIFLMRAIKFFYVDEGLLPEEYYDNAVEALNLRELADYKAKFTKLGAEKNIKVATDAIGLVEEIVKKK